MADIKVDTGSGSCPLSGVDIHVDCRGKHCPVPLVEVRKALKAAQPGQVIEVVGTHPASRKEIPMAVEALQAELLSVEGEESNWRIRIRR